MNGGEGERTIECEEAGMGVQEEIGIGNLGRGETAAHQKGEEKGCCLGVRDNRVPANPAVVHGEKEGEGEEVGGSIRIHTEVVQMGEMARSRGMVQESNRMGLVSGHVPPEQVRTAHRWERFVG